MNKSALRECLSILNYLIKAEHGSEAKGWFTIPCPFASKTHSHKVDRNPSFGVSFTETGLSGYNCLSCGQKGMLSQLPRRLYGFQILNDIQISIELSNVISSYERDNKAYLTKKVQELFPQYELPENLIDYIDLFDPLESSPRALRYLEERSIAIETAQEVGLRYNKTLKRIVIPIRLTDDYCVGFSQRLAYLKHEIELLKQNNHRIPTKIINTEELVKDFAILGYEYLNKNESVILVEGLFAYLRLWELKIASNLNIKPVSCLGSSPTNTQIELLSSKISSICIIYDNDEAGFSGVKKTYKQFKDKGIRVRLFDWKSCKKRDVDNFTIEDLQEGGIISNDYLKKKIVKVF